MLFHELYFFQFSGLEVLFIRRTELTLLPVYLELKEFTSLTSERQHYLTGEVEARFHYRLYRVIKNDCRGFNSLSYTKHLR